jgi:hypothetical protein
MTWTTADAIAAHVLKRWDRGELLAARVTGAALFPMEIPLRRPRPSEVADRFGDVLDWARALAAAARGGGFVLRNETARSRVHGANDLPVAAIVPTEADALRLIRKQTAAERFEAVAGETLARYPQLFANGSRGGRSPRWSTPTFGAGCSPCSTGSPRTRAPGSTCGSSIFPGWTPSSSKGINGC